MLQKSSHFRLQQIENAISLFSLPCLISSSFSARMHSRRTDAGSSSGFCGTSRPRMARSRIFDFALAVRENMLSLSSSIESTLDSKLFNVSGKNQPEVVNVPKANLKSAFSMSISRERFLFVILLQTVSKSGRGGHYLVTGRNRLGGTGLCDAQCRCNGGCV